MVHIFSWYLYQYLAHGTSISGDILRFRFPCYTLRIHNRIADATDSVTVDDAKDVVWEVRQKLQSQFSLDSTRLRSNVRVDGDEAGSYLTKHW